MDMEEPGFRSDFLSSPNSPATGLRAAKRSPSSGLTRSDVSSCASCSNSENIPGAREAGHSVRVNFPRKPLRLSCGGELSTSPGCQPGPSSRSSVWFGGLPAGVEVGRQWDWDGCGDGLGGRQGSACARRRRTRASPGHPRGPGHKEKDRAEDVAPTLCRHKAAL